MAGVMSFEQSFDGTLAGCKSFDADCDDSFQGDEKLFSKIPTDSTYAGEEYEDDEYFLSDEDEDDMVSECMPLAEEPAAPTLDHLPSVGSALHGSGLCKPCAWFWKPQGCQNGKECQHCHLCPNGEVKALKKLKKSLTLARPSAQQQVVPTFAAVRLPPGLEPPQSTAYVLPLQPQPLVVAPGLEPTLPLAMPSLAAQQSIGSKLHASGSCKPCAWFWKPEGCQNASNCEYCHLCSSDEIKNRKKAKNRMMRLQSEQAPTLPLVEAKLSKYVATLEDASTGDEEIPCQESDCSASQAEMHPEAEAATASDGLASVGSALHGTGECKPCAWFWKPQGCQNGKDCLHCHLCPQGEVRRRKKDATQVRSIASKKPNAKPASYHAATAPVAFKPTEMMAAHLTHQQQLIWQQQQQLLQMQMQLSHQQMQMQMLAGHAMLKAGGQ